MEKQKQIEIFQASDGSTQISVQLEQDTVWLSQSQMQELFQKSKATISEHIKNIFSEGELEQEVVVRKSRTTTAHGAIKGKTQESKVQLYNLDVVISVGYRVKSQRGTQFRIWATSKLKELLIQGYTLNKQRLEQKEQEVKILKSGIQIMGRALSTKASEEGMDWLDGYAIGLGLLDDYDHESLDKKGKTVRVANYPKEEEYQQLVETMRQEFDSDIFGKEKDAGFQSAIAQISKGMGTEDFYSSLEEKAAILLYLITKNHAFVDGNKRIAAASFLLFLERNKLLFLDNGNTIISNEALASITLFVAASKSDEMETVTRLIISVLNRNGV